MVVNEGVTRSWSSPGALAPVCAQPPMRAWRAYEWAWTSTPRCWTWTPPVLPARYRACGISGAHSLSPPWGLGMVGCAGTAGPGQVVRG